MSLTIERTEQALGNQTESLASATGGGSVLVSIPVSDDIEVSKSLDQISAVASVCKSINGPVSVESILVRWQPLAENCIIDGVIFKTGTSKDQATFFGVENAFSAMSTKFDYGKPYPFRPTVPTGLASQISPPSGSYPGVSMYLKVKGKCRCNVFIRLVYEGQMIIVGEGF